MTDRNSPSSPRAGRSTVSAATITQAESLRIVPATTDYSIGYNDALADIVAGVNRAAASPAGPEAVPQSEPPTVCVGCGHSHPPGDHFTDDLDGLCRHCSRLPSEHLCAVRMSEREGLDVPLLKRVMFESGRFVGGEMAVEQIAAEYARAASPPHPDEE